MATCLTRWRARARLALCAHLAAGRQAWRAAGAHVKQGGAALKQRRKRGGCAIRHEGTAGAGAHWFSPLRHGRPHGRHRRLSGSLGPAAPCARWPLRTAARAGPSRWPCRRGCSRTPRGSGRTCGSRRAPQRRLREEGRQRGEDGIRCWSQPVIRRHRQQQVVQRQAMQAMLRLGWRHMWSKLVVYCFPSPKPQRRHPSRNAPLTFRPLAGTQRAFRGRRPRRRCSGAPCTPARACCCVSCRCRPALLLAAGHRLPFVFLLGCASQGGISWRQLRLGRLLLLLRILRLGSPAVLHWLCRGSLDRPLGCRLGPRRSGGGGGGTACSRSPPPLTLCRSLAGITALWSRRWRAPQPRHEQNKHAQPKKKRQHRDSRADLQ